MKDTSKLPPTPNNLCGKASGYYKHLRKGEYACDLCQKAAREKWAKYRSENPEKIKEQANKYYTKNSKKIQKQIAKYRSENPDEIKERDAKSYAMNIEKRRELSRRKEHRRRARKFDNGFQNYSEQQVLDLYGTQCHICKTEIDLKAARRPGLVGWEQGLHIDHFIPLSQGGADTLENVRPSHGSCNVRKQASLPTS